MLGNALLRTRIDTTEKTIRPALVSEKNRDVLNRIEAVLETFSAAVGTSRGELDERVSTLVKGGGDLKLNKALVELAFDLARFEAPSKVDAAALRKRVFELSAPRFPVGISGTTDVARTEVIARVAEELAVSPDEVERTMFSDLKDEQLLEGFETVEPLWMLRRYNVALAQGLLLDAVRMDIALESPTPQKLRQLFRFLKFFRLLFVVQETQSGMIIQVDGPLSILEQTRAYGVRMASFLPALLLLEGWKLTADVRFRRRRYTLVLDPGMKLVSHYPDKGSWVPPELEQLLGRMREIARPEVQVRDGQTVLSLGGREVFVPDFEIAAGRRTVGVEIIWPWRKIKWSRYYELFSIHAPEDVLLCVPHKLVPATFLKKCSDHRLLFYRATPPADRILEAATSSQLITGAPAGLRKGDQQYSKRKAISSARMASGPDLGWKPSRKS